jgi:hypothetical protein
VSVAVTTAESVLGIIGALVLALIGFALGKWSRAGAVFAGVTLRGVLVIVGAVAAGVVVWAALEFAPDLKPLEGKEPTVAEIAALLTLIALTVVLWFAGGRRYVATEPFGVPDPEAPGTIAKDKDVPPELETLVDEGDKGKVGPKTFVTAPVTYYEGGSSETTANPGTKLDTADVPQARGAAYAS